MRVELTVAGRDVLDQAIGANTGREKQLMAGLTKPEQKALTGLLKKLLADLEPTTGDAT